MTPNPTTGDAGYEFSAVTPRRFALLLAALVFAAFPAEILGIKTFVIRDFGLFSYPVAFFQRQCFWSGTLPLWNPLNHCGIPFLAQWNTMALYPGALIYLLLPLAWSLPLFCLGHLFWGGLGMYHLASEWTKHRLAGAAAGIIFAFNGLSLNFLMWPSHIATFAWLPWVLWLAPLAWTRGGRAAVWAVLAGAMQMLAGGPESIAITWMLLFLIACGDWFKKPQCRRGIPLAFAGIGLLVAAVCAAQLLPFLQLATHSQRDVKFGASDWAMPLSGWANFLLPLFGTSPTTQGIYFQKDQYWTSSYYAGIATVWLIVVAIRRSRDWRLPWLLGLLVFSLVLALGDNGILFRVLRSCVPAIGMARYPVKFVMLALAVAPLIAAIGLRGLLAAPPASRRFEWISAGVIALLIGGLAMAGARSFSGGGGNAPGIFTNAIARVVCLIAGVWFVVATFKASGQKKIIFAGLFLCSIWLDFITHVPNQNPGVSPAVYTPCWAAAQLKMNPQPAAGDSRLMLAPSAEWDVKHHTLGDLEKTYLLSRLAYLADCNLLDNVPQIGGFFSLTPAEINDASVLPYVVTNRDFPALLDFMGVSQVTAPGKTFDWEPRLSAMPFVTVGQQPTFADDRSAFSVFYQTNVDFRQTVVLPPEAQGKVTANREIAARARVSTFGNQRIIIDAETPTQTMVVVSQGYYPAWKAFIDGKPARLWRANYGFQALEMPAGTHRIELRYVDAWFNAGLAISAAGLLATLALWLKLRPATPLPE